jgi:hypothetical protein
MLGLIFLGVFTLNLIVLAFDFPRTTSLTLMFMGFTIGFGSILCSAVTRPGAQRDGRAPHASADRERRLLPDVFAILAVIFICVFIGVAVRLSGDRPRTNCCSHHGSCRT